MSSLRCSLCHKSLINRILKQETFMRSILETFIEDGHLHFEPLVDHLIQHNVLQTKHCEILTISMERGHRARKLWSLLLRLPPSKFEEHVDPLLCRPEFGFVQKQQPVPMKEAMCLRCVMEHILPFEELADKLVCNGSLQHSEYRDTAVNSGIFEGGKWQVIRECLKREHANPQVVDLCQKMLNQYDIPVRAQQLKVILAQGIPCACNETPVQQRHQDDDGQPDPPELPDGPLCSSCQSCLSQGVSRDRSPRTPQEGFPELQFPKEEEESVNDSDIRLRSCRNMRRIQMGRVQNFQREVLAPCCRSSDERNRRSSDGSKGDKRTSG